MSGCSTHTSYELNNLYRPSSGVLPRHLKTGYEPDLLSTTKNEEKVSSKSVMCAHQATRKKRHGYR
jgi:hypothetical protein